MAKTRTTMNPSPRRRTPTITLDECFRLWRENDSFVLEQASKDVALQAFREWLFSEATGYGGETPFDKIRHHETLGDWAESESRSKMWEVLPQKTRSLGYVGRWVGTYSQAISPDATSRDWADSALRSEEYRDLWIAAIAADLQMEKRVGRVRVDLRRLYPAIPPISRKTDVTGWLVIADWLQERDGEAVAVAIRKAVEIEGTAESEEKDAWDAMNVRLVDEVTEDIERWMGDRDEQEKASHLRHLAAVLLDNAQMIDPM